MSNYRQAILLFDIDTHFLLAERDLQSDPPVGKYMYSLAHGRITSEP